MSIEIDPPELGFKRPFNQEVCQILHLRNPNQEAVVFKVKTTAPKHYCVRPNSGRIEPGKQVDVQVLLQALKEEPASDAKCKDKFLVQAVSVTRDMEFANVTSIFEKSSKASVVERKIRVNWLPSDSTPVSESQGPNDSVSYHRASISRTWFLQAPGRSWRKSPRVYLARWKLRNPGPGRVKEDRRRSTFPNPPPEFSQKSVKSESPPPSEPTSVLSNAKTAVSNTIPSSDELKTQLADANAHIQRLKDRLADQGLRQRKTGGEAKAAPATIQQTHAQGESGVPVQIVAGLCLLSFLIAYFFF